MCIACSVVELYSLPTLGERKKWTSGAWQVTDFSDSNKILHHSTQRTYFFMIDNHFCFLLGPFFNVQFVNIFLIFWLTISVNLHQVGGVMTKFIAGTAGVVAPILYSDWIQNQLVGVGHNLERTNFPPNNVCLGVGLYITGENHPVLSHCGWSRYGWGCSNIWWVCKIRINFYLKLFTWIITIMHFTILNLGLFGCIEDGEDVDSTKWYPLVPYSVLMSSSVATQSLQLNWTWTWA